MDCRCQCLWLYWNTFCFNGNELYVVTLCKKFPVLKPFQAGWTKTRDVILAPALLSVAATEQYLLTDS